LKKKQTFLNILHLVLGEIHCPLLALLVPAAALALLGGLLGGLTLLLGALTLLLAVRALLGTLFLLGLGLAFLGLGIFLARLGTQSWSTLAPQVGVSVVALPGRLADLVVVDPPGLGTQAQDGNHFFPGVQGPNVTNVLRGFDDNGVDDTFVLLAWTDKRQHLVVANASNHELRLKSTGGELLDLCFVGWLSFQSYSKCIALVVHRRLAARLRYLAGLGEHNSPQPRHSLDQLSDIFILGMGWLHRRHSDLHCRLDELLQFLEKLSLALCHLWK